MAKTANETKTQILPVLPLRGLPVFPYMILHFDVKRTVSINALEEAVVENQFIFLTAQKDPDVEHPTKSDLYRVGTIARIKQVLKLPDNDVRVLIEGISRATIVKFLSANPYFECEVVEHNVQPGEPDPKEELAKEALMRQTKNLLSRYYSANGKLAAESIGSFSNITDPEHFADVVSANVNFAIEDKQALLEEFDVIKRLEMLVGLLDREIQIIAIERKISQKVKGNIDKNQRDYYLREQLKVIQDELGDRDSVEAEIEELSERLQAGNVPDFVMEKAEKELDRLYKMQPGSPEASVIRGYVEWLADLPWSISTKDNNNLKRAEQVLNHDHYGMKQVKERILEFLAVRSLAPDNMKSPIICLVGPPGVGKTSIAASVARALGRNYVRISLGGVKDEAEIRGHRKTYIGSMPGRVIAALKQAGSNNPLILLDEVDKMSRDFKGDPSSALLEVLDSEQNFSFRDHYIELPFDLSNVLFITTANTTETIDRPLLDRMEVIHVSGYTDEEKLHIAKGYLIPKQLKIHGLKRANMRITDAALIEMIDNYTMESGVRDLERKIAKILRRAAKLIVGGDKKSVTITPKNLGKYLGKQVYSKNAMNEHSEIGVATGLAWTPYGGDTLFIEVNTVPGTGKIELTGSLGDVMKESAHAAVSFIRAQAEDLGVDKEFYKNTDIHIHVPEGATPKDGPSAGITMATALISALTGRRIDRGIAMTGEVTIRGRVLPIGGLKEKSLAAYRAGIRTIIIPSENEKDIEDIPENIRQEMTFVPAKEMQTVLDTALEG